MKRKITVLGALALFGGCADGDGPAQGDAGLATTSDSGGETGVPSVGESSDGTEEPSACVPGTQNDCSCVGGLEGFQVCNDAGSGFGDCMCDDAGSEEGSTGTPEACGNGTCEEDLEEDCVSCEEDCGVCEPCTEAPSCDGAETPPVIDTHASELDDPMASVSPEEIVAMLAQEVASGGLGARLIAAALAEPAVDEPRLVSRMRDAFAAHPAGADAVRRQLATVGLADPEAYVAEYALPAAAGVGGPRPLVGLPEHSAAPCDDPRMRIRVARLDVHEEDDDFLNDEIYCAITSEAPEHAELKVTPITTALDEGDSVDYSLDGGLVWGQAELTAPRGNILITYNCIESDTDNGYSDLLMAIGDAVGDADGEAVGLDGWVFPAAGVVTNLLAGALTLDGDDLLFNGSQVVPDANLLSYTYGAWWSVRREGTNLNSDWDWELRMEIWGCHDYGTGGSPG